MGLFSFLCRMGRGTPVVRWPHPTHHSTPGTRLALLTPETPFHGQEAQSAWATPFLLPGSWLQAPPVASLLFCDFTILILLTQCHQTAQPLLLPRANPQWAPGRHSAPVTSPLLAATHRQAQRHLLAQEPVTQGHPKAGSNWFLCLPIHHRG